MCIHVHVSTHVQRMQASKGSKQRHILAMEPVERQQLNSLPRERAPNEVGTAPMTPSASFMWCCGLLK